MRESIGGAWILGIVMTFIVLFASFLAISINYSKAFKVKNNVVDLIEKNEGMNENAAEDIWDYLQSQGYILKDECPSVYQEDSDGNGKPDYLGFDLQGGELKPVYGGNKALFCVKENSQSAVTSLDKTYYSIQVFFRLDLPIFGEIFTFKVTGETMSIYFADNGDFEFNFKALR